MIKFTISFLFDDYFVKKQLTIFRVSLEMVEVYSFVLQLVLLRFPNPFRDYNQRETALAKPIP